MRQYGEVLPTLAPANTPIISGVTGAGGAGLNTTFGGGYFDILVSAPGPSGSVALTFPSAPPTLFIAGEENFGTVTQATIGNVTTVSWSGGVSSLNHKRIHCEWSVSK
jgi:hypothetical protein